MKAQEYRTYDLTEVKDFVAELREIQREIRDTWVEDRQTTLGVECMLDGAFLVGVQVGPPNLILEAVDTFLQMIAGRVYQSSRLEIRLFQRGNYSWLEKQLPRQILV